jgi:hypothetical protein
MRGKSKAYQTVYVHNVYNVKSIDERSLIFRP